jgi:Uma2 family endonuclease
MVAIPLAQHQEHADVDHIVVFDNASWADFQHTLELRGDRSAPRLTYSQGVLQLMSPSKTHESIKSTIGQLVEAYCGAKQIDFGTYGGWTLERKDLARGIEPDECYVFGLRPDAEIPDLAIEVVWTSGSIDKLDVYRALGVKEVWVWRRGRLVGHILHADHYVESNISAVLPGLDLDHLASFIDRPMASQSIREYQAALARS